MPVGAGTETAKVTFYTAKHISEEFGLNIVMGASNVSHGLPDRNIINATFIAMGAIFGINVYIADPMKMTLCQTILAVDLMMGKDEWAENYISFYRSKLQKIEQQKEEIS